MDDTKPWYLSRGIWGGLIAGLMPVVAVVFGLDAETQAAILANSEAIVAGLIGVAGSVMAIVGRLRARKQIAPAKQKKD